MLFLWHFLSLFVSLTAANKVIVTGLLKCFLVISFYYKINGFCMKIGKGNTLNEMRHQFFFIKMNMLFSKLS